jgi:hypothetical protein
MLREDAMSDLIPERIPDCAERLLARAEWYADPGVVSRAKLKLASGLAAFLSSDRFSKGKTKAITLGKTIHFCGAEQFQPHTAKGLALIAHELKHVEQYERYKLVKFYAKYLWGFIRHGYGTEIDIEATAYTLEAAVKEHLQDEFTTNAGRNPCLQMDEPHTPNPEFALLTAVRFDEDL